VAGRSGGLGTSFGGLLQEAREAAGLSRADLGRLADLDPSYVYRIERGSRRPSRKAVVALARALGLYAPAVDEWLRAAGHPAGAGRRPPGPVVSTVGEQRAPWRGVEGEAPSPLTGGLAALGVDASAVTRLLHAAGAAPGGERRRVAGLLTDALGRLATSLLAQVKTAVVPVDDPRYRLVAPQVAQRLVLHAAREAIEAGGERVVVVAGAGAGGGLFEPLREAVGLATVPRIELRVVERDATAPADDLGATLLAIRSELDDGPFAVVSPDERPVWRPSRGRPTLGALSRLLDVFRLLAPAGEPHLVGVATGSGRSPADPADQGLRLAVGESILPRVYRIAGALAGPGDPRPARPVAGATGRGRRLRPVGRYVLSPAVLPALERTARGGAPASLAGALEALRRSGAELYAVVLDPGRPARRSSDRFAALLDALGPPDTTPS
jgi:hypothetical protein